MAMDAVLEPRLAWWHIHARLMPDYNAKAATYWWMVSSLGFAVLVFSASRLATASTGVWWHVALCSALAMSAGVVPVRIPGTNNSFTAGETFIFLLLLMHGVEAASLASAGEAFVGSCRTSKRWTSRLASPAMAAIALFCSGSLVSWSHGAVQGLGLSSDALVLFGSILFSLAYFVLNTWLVTMVPRLKRNESIKLHSFFGSFGWLGLAYSANAVVASFLYIAYRQIGIMAVVAATPVIAVLLTTGHYFFRRKESEEAVRAARASEAESARKHVEDLQASERRFHSAFTYASIGMALVSFDGQVRQANNALNALLRLDANGSSQLDFGIFVSPDRHASLADSIAAAASTNEKSFEGEFVCEHLDGAELWLTVHGSLFSEPMSTEACLILQVQDVTARRRAESALSHIAFHDGLTGLPNKHRFNEHVEQAIKRWQLDEANAYSVLYLDFDRFKLINDSLGHTVGDEFLIQVSRRINETLRQGDVVARLGGDEFAILIQDRAASSIVLSLAERLQQTLCCPFAIAGTEVTVSASMGITFSSVGYTKSEEVLRDADIAMYKAKALGKARYALFDVSLHQQVASRLRLEGDLRWALTNGGLSVDYQPLFDLGSGRMIGFEALARWKHAELGQISPASFIPVAEESGSMVQLTDFVLETACGQLKRWQQVHPQFSTLKMHVNIAANDVLANNFVSRIACAVITARLKPEDLSLELTENILMASLETAMSKLHELQALGVGLSVDDFGTGSSSLSHLSSLPIDCLKIDQSFVRDLAPGSKEAAVIGAIVMLGRALGKNVIAEGIETPQQAETLRMLGCHVGQGYLLGRPMPSTGVDELLISELSRSERRQMATPRLSLAGESQVGRARH